MDVDGVVAQLKSFGTQCWCECGLWGLCQIGSGRSYTGLRHLGEVNTANVAARLGELDGLVFVKVGVQVVQPRGFTLSGLALGGFGVAPRELFRVLGVDARRCAFAVGVLGKEGVEFFYRAVRVAGWIAGVGAMIFFKALADLFELLAALLKIANSFVMACQYFRRQSFDLKLSACGIKFRFQRCMGVLLAYQQVFEFCAVLGATGAVLRKRGSFSFRVNVQVFGEFFDAL